MEVVPDFTSERSPVIMSSPRRAVGLMPDPERASDSEHSREPAPVPERASVPVCRPMRAPVHVRRPIRAPVPEVSPRRAHVTEFSPIFSPSYFLGGLIGSGRKGQGEGWGHGHEDRRRWPPKLPAMASWAPCAAMAPESLDRSGCLPRVCLEGPPKCPRAFREGGVLSDLCPVLCCGFLSRALLEPSFTSCMSIFCFPVPI